MSKQYKYIRLLGLSASRKKINLDGINFNILNKKINNKFNKIAAFDIDSTIIKTKSGKTFAVNKDDWTFMYNNVCEKLQDLHLNGYNIIFFTNQAGIEKEKTIVKDWIYKIESVVNTINLDVQVYVATTNGSFRKPSPRMWEYFVETNNCKNIDLNKSFYCGDAAGRVKGWKKGMKKDFSDSDRKFAMNIGIKFYTPEEFFLEEIQTKDFILSGFNPNTLHVSDKNVDIDNLISNNQEMIINVGYPGSGKSTLTKKIVNTYTNYKQINRDLLKTKSKCISIAKEELEKGNSVIIDNTNPDIISRKMFIDIAKNYNIPIKCLYFTTPMEISQHNTNFRNYLTKDIVKKIPNVVFYKFRKRFEEPTINEGFNNIHKIEFILNNKTPNSYFYLF